MSQLNATIQTPTSILFKGEVDSVRLKTDLGQMEIFSEHATLVGTILYSVVDVRTKDAQTTYVVRQGSVAVQDDGEVMILAHEAEQEDEMTVEKLEDYLKYLVEQLESGSLNDYQEKFLRERRQALEEQLTEKK